MPNGAQPPTGATSLKAFARNSLQLTLCARTIHLAAHLHLVQVQEQVQVEVQLQTRAQVQLAQVGGWTDHK